MSGYKQLMRMAVAVSLVPVLAGAAERQPIPVDGRELVYYQAEPLSQPKGGDMFKGSDFIHPLKTPSGFVLTEIQPDDHHHHFGLWWPWKYVETGGRKILCWELQEGDGLIQARETRPTEHGLIAESDYIDRQAPGGPRTVLRETATMTASAMVDEPAAGYFLDVEILHRTAGDQPVVVTPYRYSGFALRGAASWNKDNSTILTSEGMDRDKANFTHARWVRVEGDTGAGGQAGILLMSRPDNQCPSREAPHLGPAGKRRGVRQLQSGGG